MKALVSYPGVFQDARQAALAFHEHGQLAGFVTGLALRENRFFKNLSETSVPASLKRRLERQWQRRAVTEIPANLITSYPWLDGLRIVLSRHLQNPIFADLAWDVQSRWFDRTVADRHLRGVDLVYAFEYTAHETFRRAKAEGIVCVLGMPSLDSREFEDIKQREESQFPELVTKHRSYFARKFSVRYKRRKEEVAMADLVIANSELTRLSHIRAGADPDKITAVPLAAPLPIEAVSPRSKSEALSVVWAGTFGIRKGAQHFLEAWRSLRAGDRARATVYGRNDLPDRALLPLPDGVTLAGFVPQQGLLEAFEQADVLVFPTLSDGFGAVVLEAFSRGLPVITTTSAGASEFVKHEQNGLIVPAADSAALADALRWCLDNRDALHGMRFTALDTARRWQWTDYRRVLLDKIGAHLRKAGHGLAPELLAAGA